MLDQVDVLLTNAIVMTMNEAYQVYEPGAIAVKGELIEAVGLETDIKSAYSAKQTIDCGGKVLMPGLVNTHTHVPMTLLRGLADDLRLDVWLMGYMLPVEREFVSPDFVRLGTSLACAELIRTGVTCFADMYYFEEQVAEAAAEAGMRAICGETVMKFPTPDAQDYEEALQYSREFISRWRGHSLIVPTVAPHAPYTTTKEILLASSAMAREFDVPLLIHIAETAQEVEMNRELFGMPVVPYVKKQTVFEAKTLAAHCVHLDEGEINTLVHHKVGVAHNPSSNLKLASGFAPVSAMLEAGLDVGIGTDGSASNNDLDMFEEMRLASFIAKAHSGDPTALPARKVVAMATRLGARAIHLGELIGSLEPGKRADLILIDVSTTHNSPRFRRDEDNIYAQIVYASKSTDVTDVMVNGRWLMQDRTLKTIDEASLIAKAQEYAHKIDAFLLEREQSVLSKLIAIGGASEAESFEVQAKGRITDPATVHEALKQDSIDVLRFRHYHEFDTYFSFADPRQGYLRYREDEFVGEDNEVANVRYRLTLIGPAREKRFPSEVILSRSRFIAPASHSLRFYREYFKPVTEISVAKDRLRWRVLFHGTEFYINLDTVEQPGLGHFVEVKSRTWSRRDADHKAEIATELLRLLGVAPEEMVSEDYIEIVGSKS